MSFTLLLDLDDTLLDTNMGLFIPAYFQALAGALAGRIDPNEMLSALMEGTKRMFANEDPTVTLREVFDGYFFQKLGIDRDSLQPEIDKFYDDVFPSLGVLTKPRPAAVELVEWAFSRGFRVVIATNPVFPLKAIHHRLRWAGLSPEQFPFTLVTSYENMHFTKSPAYYAEVMARLGWPEDPVLMVGDDLERDINPARVMGISVFHVTASGESEITPAPDGVGTISDVRPWLETIDLNSLQINSDHPESIIAVLRSTPAGLADLAENIPQEQWTRCPECDEWSLNEILCHLRDVEMEVNIPRVRTMIEETNPFISGQLPNEWVQQRDYDMQDGHQALKVLAEARKQLVGILSGLSSEDWKRTARHSVFGPTDMQELVGFVANHDRSHIQQVIKTLSEVVTQ
jgi:FMN phosphatase YigB (HAD superfamily)